ncbi:extracellular matrix protein precursor [Metarhizium album ARSEF 1941]|uniref:Extracellular matrix protein n=1 Tax=Metarhizium album (strain ARSEF 1941) TaxID=1081103 RepID=A0A0B2X2P5_METAS|nr:extracellular matrix protein precursor [Metarhizium album ARSEF 1941]KHO00018.1 extracellular matrix protein precursor [Metarhizium album ARSEF 1941]
MKLALVLSALVAFVAAQKPEFLNSNYQITENQPFNVKFSGSSKYTISLQTGPRSDLKSLKTLDTDASNGSADIVLSGVPSGTYALKIEDNADPANFNYSPQFAYVGTGAPLTTSSASTTGSSTGPATVSSSRASSAASTVVSSLARSTESSIRSSIESSTTVSSVANATSGAKNSSTPARSTASQSLSSTRSTTAVPTTIPNAGIRATPMAFVVGVVAALAYLA